MGEKLGMQLRKYQFFMWGVGSLVTPLVSLNNIANCFSTIGPKGGKLCLRREHIELMQKSIAAQKLVSSNAFSMVKVVLERVDGMDEGLELERHENQDQNASEGQLIEKGLVKLWTVEGKVGDLAYIAKFSANYNVSISFILR